jgi:uroporphyrinogen decarboxylase
MTKRETVCKALAHEPTPRLPYCLEFTREAAEHLQEHLGTPDLAGALGNHIRTVSPPWWQFVNVDESYSREPTPQCIPPVRGVGSFEAFGERLQRLREQTDAYILAVIYAFNFEKAWMLRSMERFMVDMVTNPAFVHELLDRMMELNMAMLRTLVSFDEADGFMLGSDWGAQQALLISPGLWREFIREREAVCYRLVREAGKHLWVHSCGNIMAILPDLVEIGLQGLNPVQSEAMDLRTLKARFGRELTFWGGVSTQQTLPYGRPDQVRAEVERVIQVMAPGGGYVLGPSQQIQADVPVENILAFAEVARAHG